MRVKVDDLAATVMKELEAYEKLSTEAMKQAVKSAGKTVKQEVQERAPKDTGSYAKGWRVTTEFENAHKLKLVVHATKHSSLSHLLEHGHATRSGGRARAFPHIAPAQEAGEKQLQTDIERALRNG